MGMHPHAPLKSHPIAVVKKIASASLQEIVKQNRATRTWRRCFSWAASRSLIKEKKKGERSMYTEKKFFGHCSCLWRRATAGLWRCCVSDEWACLRVSTTLALQVRFPLLHRKEIIFFEGRPLRTFLQHGMVFHKDADQRMIGHQRSSTHGWHFRRAGENFPQARKSGILYLGGVTLYIHAKATTPMHAKLKHQVSCRSRRCPKNFQHTLRGEAKASANLSTVTKSRTIVEKSKFLPCGPKSGHEARHETNCPW